MLITLFQEEWVVCRIFQKSAVKKPQPTRSSQPSLGSPCDTNSIANEFGDIELPNLNSIANSSNGFCNISPQSYNNSDINNKVNMNNMNLNMNWGAPSLSWPTSLLGSVSQWIPYFSRHYNLEVINNQEKLQVQITRTCHKGFLNILEMI